MATINKVNEILKTLPIGYYLGQSIHCELSTESTSYFDPMNEKIIISYSQLPLEDLNDDDPEIEDNIRCMLYHEISHAILTPRRLRINDVINIFEDQRIETLLSNYFHRVDFESFVRKVTKHFEPTTPMNPKEYFFQIVRFGEGPEKFIEKRNTLIKKHVKLNKNTPYFDEVRYYEEDINEFYLEVLADFEERFKPEEEEKSEEKPEENNEENNEALSGTGSSSSEDKEEKSKKAKEEKIEKSKELFDSLTEEEIKELLELLDKTIKSIISKYNNKDLTSKIKSIIDNAQRKKRNQAGAINAYSGKLNPKNVKRIGKVEDYKWWTKPAVRGEQNRYDKIQLNLFCDVSGSFRYSENKINQLIKSLIDIERINPNFKFELIKMGNKNRIDKNDRKVECTEGNWLTNDIIDIYKKVQTPNTTIYNIVVFDGDAQSFDGSSRIRELRARHERAFSAWNHSNCIIVSDESNQYNFDKWAPNAKRIYTYDYANELENNIIKSLGLLLK